MLAHLVGIQIFDILPKDARYAVGHLQEFHFALVLRATGLGRARSYSDRLADARKEILLLVPALFILLGEIVSRFQDTTLPLASFTSM